MTQNNVTFYVFFFPLYLKDANSRNCSSKQTCQYSHISWSQCLLVPEHCTTVNSGSSSSNFILGQSVFAVPFRFKWYSICATPRVFLINCLFVGAIMMLMNRERMSWVPNIVCQLCIRSSVVTVSSEKTPCCLTRHLPMFRRSLMTPSSG